MKIILLYEMNHEIEGLFHDVHLGGLITFWEIPCEAKRKELTEKLG